MALLFPPFAFPPAHSFTFAFSPASAARHLLLPSVQYTCVMEEERKILFTLSDLIQRGRPLAAASSLVRSPSTSTLKPHKDSGQNHRRETSLYTCQNPNDQTLKPLNHPAVLVGSLTLPSFANRNSPIKCSCFQFSDDSATICCDILDFDPKMIGQKIRILAWNFIPLKCGDRGAKGGFLEIISWEFFQACSGNVCSLSDFSSFCLCSGVCDVKDNSNSSCLIFGLIESISPVSVVPCAGGGSGSRSICGFLVNVLVCECQLCVSKILVSELKILSEKNVKDHCFIKKVIVYFCGLPSSWHPVISLLVGDIVLLVGLKKKLVFIKKEESQLMYVTTEEVSLHIAKLFEKRCLIPNADIRGKGECGCYTGIITGVYMQGMVVELDQDVMLLLTDQHLTVPHCTRVGAIVTLKNVHFLDPKFPWGKMLILGACCRTSVHVESFSPLETGCHLKSNSQSLLLKFIDSLCFAARLWALLVVSSFRKKFAGILSEKEILGSKHKEGLAQKYANSHLPPSAFHFRHGVLVEFCKHDFCSVGKEAHYGHLKLVVPIANLISYCDASWKKILDCPENFMGCINESKPVSCGSRSYVQSTRRVLRTAEIGVLVLGTLKVSLPSGRLQLVDATGDVDIMLNLPATWGFDRIFEAKDFTLIMEDIPPKLVDLDSTMYQPLSCRSIFSNAPPLRRMKTSIYLYHCPTDEDSRSHSLFFDWKGNSQELDSGKFHLIMLTHKFPIQQKFEGDLAKKFNVFAEAIVLPWDLVVSGKYEDAVMTMVSSGHWRDFVENFTRTEKHHTHKRCKIEQASVEGSDYGSDDAGNGLSCHFRHSCSSYSNSSPENTRVSNHSQELPCLIATKGVNCHCLGMLHCSNEHTKIVSGCKLLKRKVLLEFCLDSFCTYEVLRIGRCYIIKHQEKDMLCSIKENYQVTRANVFISSGTCLRSLTFSSIDTLQSSDDVMSNQQFELPCLTGSAVDSGSYSDVNVFVPSSALNFLETVIKKLDSGPNEPRNSFEEESDIQRLGGPMIMQSSGTSCSDYPLPEGDLITLHGRVVASHDCSDDSFPGQSRRLPREGYLPSYLQGNRVCVHVLVDNQIVRIFGDLGKQAYPVGLGRDVHATFHRILVLSGQNKYMMTPVSFVTINDTSLKNEHFTGEFNYASGTLGLPGGSSPRTFPTSLVADALQISDLKPMQFRCRVVAVYILVLKHAKTTAVFQPSGHSILSAINIPFAGFVMDDGSSSCCCWADSERAAALLGLEPEQFILKDSAETSRRPKADKGSPYNSTTAHLNQILEKHSRVVVKNYGSIFDSSSQELSFSAESNRLITSSDEDLLRSLITNAFSTSWNIVGSVMDPKASNGLEERLSELDIAVPPLMNIWAARVCHTDMLREARNIIQELV